MKKVSAILHIVSGPLFILTGFDVASFFPMGIGLLFIAIGVIELVRKN